MPCWLPAEERVHRSVFSDTTLTLSEGKTFLEAAFRPVQVSFVSFLSMYASGLMKQEVRSVSSSHARAPSDCRLTHYTQPQASTETSESHGH